jgi:hypothetical protein
MYLGPWNLIISWLEDQHLSMKFLTAKKPLVVLFGEIRDSFENGWCWLFLGLNHDAMRFWEHIKIFPLTDFSRAS